MQSKDEPPSIFRWQEDERRKKRRDEYEARQRYLDSLFYLPNATLKEPEYLIERFLPRGYLAILAGDSKKGKTFFTTALAVAIATGIKFADLKTTQSPVLWLSLEEDPRERSATLGTFEDMKTSPSLVFPRNETPNDAEPDREENEGGVRGGSETDFPDDWQIPLPVFTCYEPIAIDSEEGIAVLQHWVNRTGAKLIVVDPLHAAHSGRSLKDGWAARKTLQPLKAFCSRNRVTALILHHLGGNAGGARRVAESAQLSAVASMFMLFTPIQTHEEGEENYHEARQIKLECRGRGAFANRTWYFECNEDREYRECPPPEATHKHLAEDLILASLTRQSPQSVQELTKNTQLAASTVGRIVSRLERKGVLRISHASGKQRHYQLKPSKSNRKTEKPLEK